MAETSKVKEWGGKRPGAGRRSELHGSASVWVSESDRAALDALHVAWHAARGVQVASPPHRDELVRWVVARVVAGDL